MTKELYIESGNHWINAPYPLKPNDTEVKMYQQHLLTGTTLLLHQKTDRCYNCAKCRQQYPLKLLNKQRGMSKNV